MVLNIKYFWGGGKLNGSSAESQQQQFVVYIEFYIWVLKRG